MKRSAYCVPQILTEDIHFHIFEYLDVITLTTIRRVNSTWKISSDQTEIWSEHCRVLWRGKQNIPYELWARFPPSEEHNTDDNIRSQIEYLLLLQLLQGSVLTNEDLEGMLSTLHFIQKIQKKRMAAPISHIIREEQILLENQLEYCRNEEEHWELVSMIVQNMQSSVVITPDTLDNLHNNKYQLLTWRGSYIASIIDSTRCCPTYEEYRRIVDWLVYPFSSDVHVFRATKGGHQQITNLSCFEKPGNVVIAGCRMIGVQHMFMIRQPEDWGWFGTSISGPITTISTFDLILGYENYRGRLMVPKDGQGQIRLLHELLTPLKDLPENDLYCI